MSLKNKYFYLPIALLLIVYGAFFAKAIETFNVWRIKKSNTLLTQSQEVKDENQKLTLLQEAAFLNPNESTYLKSGILAETLGYSDMANSYLGRVKTGNGFYQLGGNYFLQGKYDKAIESYSKAIVKEKKAEYYLGRVKAELALLKIDDAKADADRSLGVTTGDEARFYHFLIANIADQTVGSITFSEEFAKIANPLMEHRDPSNHANTVFVTLNALNYPQLAVWYLKSEEQKGNLNRDGYLMLAKHYLSINDYQSEYDSLLKALQKDTYYPQTYQQLADVASKLGKTDEASQYSVYYKKLTW